MFKCGLLATTALVIVGSLSFLAAQSAAVAQPPTAGTERDRNKEFLCSYGNFEVSYNRDADSGAFYIMWNHVATPIKGHGKTVSRIIVREAMEQSASRLSNEFSAGIYSNTASGFPGKQIAAGVGNAPQKCGIVTVSIDPTMLKKNTTYWVEETQYAQKHSNSKVFWAADPKVKNKAYVQHHFSSYYYNSQGFDSSTAPWQKQHSGPYLKVK
jgi:hypothetical protein